MKTIYKLFLVAFVLCVLPFMVKGQISYATTEKDETHMLLQFTFNTWIWPTALENFGISTDTVYGTGWGGGNINSFEYDTTSGNPIFGRDLPFVNLKVNRKACPGFCTYSIHKQASKDSLALAQGLAGYVNDGGWMGVASGYPVTISMYLLLTDSFQINDYWNGGNNTGVLFSVGQVWGAGDANGFQLGLNADGGLKVVTKQDNYATVPTALTKNVWHHVAITVPNADASNMTMFVDGSPVDMSSGITAPISIMVRAGWENITFGGQMSNILIADFRYYNTPLTFSEISEFTTPPTGVNKLRSIEGQTVYPNVNNGEFMIKFENAANRTISVIDIFGREVFSAKIENELNSISIGNIAPGYYLVRSSDTSGHINISKILITQ